MPAVALGTDATEDLAIVVGTLWMMHSLVRVTKERGEWGLQVIGTFAYHGRVKDWLK